MKLGIIGGGVVGHATARAFSEHVEEVRVYDTHPTRRTFDRWEDLMCCGVVMVCLPTPAKPDGSCDTSIVGDFLNDVYTRGHADCNLVLRSTVPIGYTRSLAHKFPNITHSPEFLTARCAVLDAQAPTRNVLGVPNLASPKGEGEGWKAVHDLYSDRWPHVPVHLVSSDESEAAKLMTNSFFAVKLAFFNECYQLCQKFNMSYDVVIDVLRSDGRIHPSHTQVPGPDGKLGFGGACLPKDLRSLVHQFYTSEVTQRTLSAADVTNLMLRENVK